MRSAVKIWLRTTEKGLGYTDRVELDVFPYFKESIRISDLPDISNSQSEAGNRVLF